MIRDMLAAPLFRLFVAWHLAWGAVALLTDASPLIELLNGILLAVACGVTVAYLPNVVLALRSQRPSSGAILAFGIWIKWLSTVEQRGWSIIWRLIGQPVWFVNTDFASHFLSLAVLAGLCHLAGPEAIDGRVPTRSWIHIGIIVGAGVLLAWLTIFFTRLVDLR